MADLSDVETALCVLITAALYPKGSTAGSLTGATIKIYRGWPTNRALNSDLAAGNETVTVYSAERSTKDTSRYPRIWRTVSSSVPTLTVNVTGSVLTFGGSGGAGQTAGVSVDGVAYAYSLKAADTPATVALAFQALIPSSVADGNDLTTGGQRITGQIVGDGLAMMETRRQEQGFIVSVWCPTPESRDVLSAAIDNSLSATDWLPLADGTSGRLLYKDTVETDNSQNANLYRRNLSYTVEYPTIQTMTGSQMLFGVGVLSGAGPTVGFGCTLPGTPMIVPPLGAVRFDAWYDPRNSIDQQCAAALSPAEYQDRLPGNAVVGPSGASWPVATQATIDAEISAAVQAGLGFWAFDSYQPDDTLSLALQLYLTSSLRSKLRFCMLGQTSNWGEGGQDQPPLLRDISMMTQPGYLTVLNNRPLYLVLDASASQLSGLPPGGVSTAITFIRNQVQAGGGGNPYVVWLSGAAFADYSNVAAAQAAGADACGAYAVPRLNGSAQPFAALASTAKEDWAQRSASGFPMIPTAMTGWDQRPLIQTPQPYYPVGSGLSLTNYYDAPSMQELGQQIVDLATYVNANSGSCPAQVGLIYAWNELAEGGWLMPTYTAVGPDISRVAAVGLAVAQAVAKSRDPKIELIS